MYCTRSKIKHRNINKDRQCTSKGINDCVKMVTQFQEVFIEVISELGYL